MSDLISRRNAMMKARPECLNPNQKGHEEYNKAWNDGVKAYWNGLKELPSELEWIPCSERLPKEYGWYLITTNEGSVDIATFDDGKNAHAAWSGCDAEGFYLFALRGIEVIAWQPLPEPYKEDM